MALVGKQRYDSRGGVLAVGRLRIWFLLGAVIVCAILFAGLIHDFAQSDPAAGWFTARPLLVGALLVLGYLFMVGHRFASRGEGK